MTQLYCDYLRERFRPALFLPVLGGLWLAAVWASSGDGTARRQVMSLALLAVVLLQFRLWDDLEDLPHDRRVHPDRVLARAATWPFRRLLAALVVASLSVAATAGPAVIASLAALDVLFLACYRLVRSRVAVVVWRFPILLSKYPAFVLLAAMAAGTAPPGARAAVAMLAALLGAGLYEAIHDTRGWS